jgi:predicted DNA-binding transcriptional regulator YafY
MVQMVRESNETGYMANSRDFMKEFEVSRRTVARDLDFLRDEENAPLAYDEARHGYVLPSAAFLWRTWRSTAGCCELHARKPS